MREEVANFSNIYLIFHQTNKYTLCLNIGKDIHIVISMGSSGERESCWAFLKIIAQ